MKKPILLIVLALMVSCKNDKSQKAESEPSLDKEEEKIEVLKSLKVPLFSKWFNSNIETLESQDKYLGDSTYLLVRKDVNKNAHLAINNLKINVGSKYKVSVIAKKGIKSSNLALRFQGKYPNRVDAVFNLEKGLINGPILTGDLAENESAEIEDLGNGWFKCSLIADLYEDFVRVMIGPTKNTIKAKLWETRTLSENDILIVPSSLKIEELTN
ncbi:MAG: hypothetical protein KJP09_07240 [Bacteroidia bacterium]|nr:hypothetical protein [Bacteroidia bacterium]MBT8309676.1 hypothetical protein [Bacteroidia bacterium]NND11530.1 hypothetical protein [Flavobacteriaceae bacterium]NNK27462.1 hypothetical protein [Flavobacteriaceae bacterium]NNL60413.1 hypothetical protein [Flavobacteriaceae bacterium]